MQTKRLPVNGMTCGGCVNMVTRALLAVDGVADADVSLRSGIATVQYDQHSTSPADLSLAVQRAGYETGDSERSPPHRGGCCG